MRRLRVVLLVFGVLFLIAAFTLSASGQDCGVYRGGYPTYAPVVREKVVTEIVTAFPVFAQLVQVPLYSTVYTGPPPAVAAPVAVPGMTPAPPVAALPAPASPAASAATPQQDAVLEALQRLEARLASLEARGQATPPQSPASQAAVPQAPTPQVAVPDATHGGDLARLFVGRCASCHSRQAAAGSGAGLVLTDGQGLASLGPAERLKVWGQVYAGKMPKGGKKLSDEEISLVAEWLAGTTGGSR